MCPCDTLFSLTLLSDSRSEPVVDSLIPESELGALVEVVGVQDHLDATRPGRHHGFFRDLMATIGPQHRAPPLRPSVVDLLITKDGTIGLLFHNT